MAEEVAKAIKDMAPIVESNPEAKAFLEGFKHGLLCAKPDNKE